MNFWFKLFGLTLILNNIVMDPVEFEFNFVTMGHSGFLITWKGKRKINEACIFKFGHRIKDDPKDEHIPSSDFQFCRAVHQHIMHSLKENTLYEVIIQQYASKEELVPEKEYTFVKKTNSKTNKKPAKPEFICRIVQAYNNFTDTLITWLPCGRKKNCNGKEPGSHFAVKLKVLDRRDEFIREVINSDYTFIYSMVGIVYEVTVLSVYNDIYTESDPQEIFLKPDFGAVRLVKVVSYPNSSILVTWKPPIYLLEGLYKYRIIIANDSSYINNYLTYLTFSEAKREKISSISYTNAAIEEKLFDKPDYELVPGVTYFFSIVPYGNYTAGLETQVKYTLPVKKDD